MLANPGRFVEIGQLEHLLCSRDIGYSRHSEPSRLVIPVAVAAHRCPLTIVWERDASRVQFTLPLPVVAHSAAQRRALAARARQLDATLRVRGLRVTRRGTAQFAPSVAVDPATGVSARHLARMITTAIQTGEMHFGALHEAANDDLAWLADLPVEGDEPAGDTWWAQAELEARALDATERAVWAGVVGRDAEWLASLAEAGAYLVAERDGVPVAALERSRAAGGRRVIIGLYEGQISLSEAARCLVPAARDPGGELYVLIEDGPGLDTVRATFSALGFAAVAQRQVARRSLSDPLPPDLGRITLVPTDPGAAILRATFAAAILDCADRDLDPEAPDVELESLRVGAGSAFDPALWCVAYCDGAPIGVALGHRYEAAPDIATLAFVGLVPSARGQGLGRQLHVAALSRFAAAGVASYLDGADVLNLPMLSVFGSSGCERHYRETLWRSSTAPVPSMEAS